MRDNFVPAYPVDVLSDILGGSPTQNVQTQLRYDYTLIPEQHRATVIDSAVDIVNNSRKAKDSLITIGQRLTHVKGLLEHGQFSDWCATEFEMSQRTAQNMMNVAKTFGGKNETVSLLSDSALYLLAAPSIPETAREAVIEQAKANGASPSKTEVKRIIASHKPAPVLNTAPAGEHGEWLAGLDADFETAKAGRRVVTLDELPVIASVTVPARSQAEIDAAIDEEIALARQHVRNGVEARRDEDEEISHPLDCYEDDETPNAEPVFVETDQETFDRLKWPRRMRDLHELKMWLKETATGKAREYTKLTGWPAPTGLISSIETMIVALEQAMDATEQEAAANVNQ